jgi:hypothetical protein
MPVDIKLSSLGLSAGKAVDGSVTISGSDMATTYLTGNIDQNVYRHLPDTIGSMTGTSPRPFQDQYQFYEFDGKIPTITIDSLTSPDNTSQYSGYRIQFTYTVTGVLPTETYNVKLYINDVYTNTQYLETTNVSGQSRTYDDEGQTYLVQGEINTIKLVVDVVENTKSVFDTETVLVWPLNLRIIQVQETSSAVINGGGNYRYDTGSVTFRAIVGGGEPPYFYNWTGSGYVSSPSMSFNNALTTTEVPITLVVKDSYETPDTATASSLPTMRRPITVSYSYNTTPEPYVSYTLTGTENYNVAPLELTYYWRPTSGRDIDNNFAKSPNVVYTTTGSLISSTVQVTASLNNTVNYTTTLSVTPAMVAPTFTSTTYAPSTELFSIVLNTSALGTPYSTSTLKYDIDYRLKDTGGSYGSWTSITSNSTSTSTSVSISGKTTTTQVVQARVRARRTNMFGANPYESTYYESTEITIPIKGVITLSNQTDLLTGDYRDFDGTVTLGGTADTSFSVTSVTAVSTGGTVSASASKPSSNILRIRVRNMLTNVNDGTASHVVTVVDGNGYTITKSFTTQYKINYTAIGLAASWTNARAFTSAEITFSNTIPSGFSAISFQRKVESGGIYSNENSGVYTLGLTYTAPTSNQTWYYRLKASGGAYTTSDYYETTVTMYGYPGQSYNYTPSASPSSGKLSEVGAVIFSVSQTGGNFAGISATLSSYYPSGNASDTRTLSAASIPDNNSSFSFSSVNLYESTNCGSSTGTAYGVISLRYDIDASRYYTHGLSNTNVTVSRELSSVSVSNNSGFVDGYAIRGNDFSINASYVTSGPPYTSAYAGYQLIYLDDTSMNSTVSGQGNYYNGTQYLRTQTTSTYCRFTASRTKTISGRARGNTYSVTWYGNEYSIIDTGWTYAKQPSGEQSVGKTVYIRGRRIDSATAPTIIQTSKGNTEIAFQFDGTPSGPDGTVDINSDGITRTYEYSTNGSTGWTNCASVVTLNASLLLTTVYFRQKYIHNDWGNTVYSSVASKFLEDYDYSLILTNTNQSQEIIQGSGSPITGDGNFSNVQIFSLSDTDPGVGNGSTINENTYFQSYFYNVNGLDTDGSFPGAYLDNTHTPSGQQYISRVYLDGSTWRGQPYSALSAVKNSSSDTPSTEALGLIAVNFLSPSEAGFEGLITITGQKSSSNTYGQKKYYFRYKTRVPTNQISYLSLTTDCGTFTVTYRTGTVQTANKLQIQTSTDNSTWSTAQEWTSGVNSNTNFSKTVSGVGSGVTIYIRARLLLDSTVLTTTGVNTYYNPGTPANSSISNAGSNGCEIYVFFNAGTTHWDLYTTNEAGSTAYDTYVTSGTNDINYTFDPIYTNLYWVVVWYREDGGCISSTSRSDVYTIYNNDC